MKKQKNPRFRETLVQSLKFPRDLVFQESVMTLTGECEILLENYKMIQEYTRDHLLVQAKDYRIRIEGQELKVLYYTSDEMRISGRITTISYER